jgi:hypothetical protein
VGHPEEIPRVEQIVQETYGQLPRAMWAEGPLGDGRIALDTLVQVGQPFFRTVAKVIFHYALKVFPDPLMERPQSFNPCGTYIRQGVGNGFVRELRRQIVGNFHVGQRPANWSHILIVERNRFQIVGYAQFFVGPESMPFPFEVRLGRNPARIIRHGRSGRPTALS